jgi:hypothetical protein
MIASFEWIITPPLPAEYRNSPAPTKALEFQMEAATKSPILRISQTENRVSYG